MILRPDLGDGIQIVGRFFDVQEVLAGEFRTGDRITVIRTDLPDEGAIEDQPPFQRDLYVLALKSTDNSYGIPAWYTIAGPSGRIPFERIADGSVQVQPEIEENEIQEALRGFSLRQVKEALRS